MINVAVFASGSGTNFQAIVDSIENGDLQANLALLVCDKPGAYVIERAERAGVPTFVFSPKSYQNKVEFENVILEKLMQSGVEFIVLAGYMRLIGDTLLSAYKEKMINIHPSLLPAFPGKDAIGQAFRAGVKETGVTIHFVDEGMDTGPIIAQKGLQVKENETIESLQSRIHQIEHTFYPETLNNLFKKMVKVRK